MHRAVHQRAQLIVLDANTIFINAYIRHLAVFDSLPANLVVRSSPANVPVNYSSP